jgi:hypothetical protein
VNKIITSIALLVALNASASGEAATIDAEETESGAVIYVEGPIIADDIEAFRNISLRYEHAIVVLNSPGGSLIPAIEIGKIIKIAGFITAVPSGASCASSCALIWLAGDTRLLSPSGRVGFHASYRDNNGKLEESGVANALIGNYLTKLNLSERGIVFATSAPPEQIKWLDTENKKSAGIDFEELLEDTSDVEPAPTQAPIIEKPTGALETFDHDQLPSYLPKNLSQVRSRWVQYASNAFYDASSIERVADINGRFAGRKFWVLIDNWNDPKDKYGYSIVQKFVYCPSQSVSNYSWTDYKRDGKAKRREISTRGEPAQPGTASRVLVDIVCSVP